MSSLTTNFTAAADRELFDSFEKTLENARRVLTNQNPIPSTPVSNPSDYSEKRVVVEKEKRVPGMIGKKEQRDLDAAAKIYKKFK
jgi:hypothetical protein